MNTLVADLLRARLRTAGADPLFTYYDLAKDERVELSGVTFGNWVAKTANLVTFDLAIAPGDAVGLPLARSAPGHWMTAVWQVALWQVGAYVDVTAGSDDADVLVCGPAWQAYADSAADVLACSLHPFATGLGVRLGAGLPPSVTDMDLAVRAQPDSYTGGPVDPGTTAWRDGDLRLTQAAVASGPGSHQRRLIVPTDPWSTARDGIVAALIGGGSVVVLVGATADDLTRISASERAV